MTPEDGAQAAYRVFGSKPGAYGAGLQALIDERGWDDGGRPGRRLSRLERLCLWRRRQGEAAHGLFSRRLGRSRRSLHNQDNREHDLLDTDDYYQFEGGLAAAVQQAVGREPPVYHNDHSRPERPAIRAAGGGNRPRRPARVVNPKWIAGVMRHGYKGAFEMAATVDYLFAFSRHDGRRAAPPFRGTVRRLSGG